MAHFAELIEKTDPTGFTADKLWVVERVIVVDNKHVPSDEHVDGETWCHNFFNSGTWKQTSYNRNFRKKYAGIGDIYDEAKNIFRLRQPYASWSLDVNNDWQPPVAPPWDVDAQHEFDYACIWDEANTKWTGIKKSDESNWNWDASSLTWVSA